MGFGCQHELLREAVEHVFLGGAGTDARRRETAKLGVDAGTRGPRGEGSGQHGPRDGRRQSSLKTRPHRTSAGLVVSAHSSAGPGVLTTSCSKRPRASLAISSAGAPSLPGPGRR